MYALLGTSVRRALILQLRVLWVRSSRLWREYRCKAALTVLRESIVEEVGVCLHRVATVAQDTSVPVAVPRHHPMVWAGAPALRALIVLPALRSRSHVRWDHMQTQQRVRRASCAPKDIFVLALLQKCR